MVGRWMDGLAVWWLRRRGMDVVRDAGAHARARDGLMACWSYVRRSGHLNTVGGRVPRAVPRVLRSLEAGYVGTAPLARDGGGRAG